MQVLLTGSVCPCGPFPLLVTRAQGPPSKFALDYGEAEWVCEGAARLRGLKLPGGQGAWHEGAPTLSTG